MERCWNKGGLFGGLDSKEQQTQVTEFGGGHGWARNCSMPTHAVPKLSLAPSMALTKKRTPVIAPNEQEELATVPPIGAGISNTAMATRAAKARAGRRCALVQPNVDETTSAKAPTKPAPTTTGTTTASEEKAPSQNSRLVASVKTQTLLIFDLLHKGADGALEEVTEPVPKDPKRTSGLLSIAGKLALAGVAGGAGSAVALALRSALGADAAKGVADMVKAVIKGGLGVGAEADAKPSGLSLVSQFRDIHKLKLHAAKAVAEARFSDQLSSHLEGLEADMLARIRNALVAMNASPEIMRLQKRQTLIEWLNFKARANNGEGKEESNVSARALAKDGHLGIDQRWRSKEADAVLELNVDMKYETSRDGKAIWDLELHSMHLHGVHPNARAAISGMGTVGDVPINRIVRAIPSRRTSPTRHSMEIPMATMVVGADGTILSSSYEYDRPTLSSEKIWWMAQHMSLGLLSS